MSYPNEPNLRHLADQIIEYARLQHEYGAKGVQDALDGARNGLSAALERLKALPVCADLAAKEPDDLEGIRRLRADGPRRMWKAIDPTVFLDKLEGAMLARFAGCTLGAPVEFWEIKDMEDWAQYIGMSFPPQDYWTRIKRPSDLRYGKSPCAAYTKEAMDSVPVDDDITYTILGMLIAEDYGVDFTTEDVGKAWLRYLPMACTAEHVALENLKAGISALEAADKDNPYCQWIGADIRSDPWAYIAPAYPEKAAELAYRDAYLSHRRNGIYGEMFFSAAQSAAFAVDNAVEALTIGLSEIPSECALHGDILWALERGKSIKNYREARDAVEEHFQGMSGVHTNNNACLSVFGLMIGGGDVSKTISETVAMGMDNDCTAATVGSIAGAIAGKKGVPEHWYRPFGDKLFTYMNGAEEFAISDLVKRFANLAERVHAAG